jgi:hypothetical protein
MKALFLAAIMLFAIADANAQISTSKTAPDGDYCEFLREVLNLKLKPELGVTYMQYVPHMNVPEPCTPEAAKRTFDSDFGAFRKHGPLDELEGLIIFDYARTGFRYLNAMAEGRIPPAPKLLEVMDRGLLKLPTYKGVVYKGLPYESSEKFKPGFAFRFKDYVSTSKNLYTARSFATDRPVESAVILKINSESGKDISQWYGLGDEAEVIFPRGSRFKVTNIIKKFDGASEKFEYFVEVEEVAK